MKKKYLLAVLIFSWIITHQANAQQVISSAGNFFENSAGSISGTVGEALIATHITSDKILTQGFHQTYLYIVGIEDINESLTGIEVYPNPAENFVYLKMNHFEGCSYVLYNMNGSVLHRNAILGETSEIDFSYLLPAVYLLKVFRDHEEIQSFKILKY